MTAGRHWKFDGELSHDYATRHKQIAKARGNAGKHDCFFCIIKQARHWAQIHNTSGRLLVHYVPSCTSCHSQYDSTPEGRAKTVNANRGNTYGKANKGKKKPPGFGAKISAAQNRLWADPEWRAQRTAQLTKARWSK